MFTGTIRKVVVDVREMTAGEKAEAKKAVAEGARKLDEANEATPEPDAAAEPTHLAPQRAPWR